VPSFVRLESIENLEGVFADALCITRSAGFKVGLRLPDRECGSQFLRVSAVGIDELPNQEVKRRAEVVDGIPSNDAQALGGVLRSGNCVLPLSSLRVILDNNFVGVGLEEPLNGRFEIGEMLLGPVNF